MRRRNFLAASGGLAAVLAWPVRAIAAAIGYPRLLQGPLIGAPTPTGFTVWARVSGGFSVAVEYATDRNFTDMRATAAVIACEADDFTVRIPVTGLTPGRDYHYRLMVDGKPDRYAPLPFVTRTLPERPTTLRIAFGSCARLQFDPAQPVWAAVDAVAPDLFLWIGDNIYADSDQASTFTDTYARQRAIPRLAALQARVPQLAIWDDHDFGFNNSDRTNPVKAMTLRLFERWWPNPAAGTADVPGVFFRHAIGPVDLFMLDGRYHRSPADDPDGPAKTMLGTGQLAWLKRELKASRATFKLLASGVAWSAGEAGSDSWASYLHERNVLLDFIRDERITGVFGISGDVHMGEANCVPWSERGGYDFYDFVSSGLAQTIKAGFVDQRPEVRLREPWVGSANFGLLDFTFGPDPQVAMSVRTVTGAAAWAPVVVKASDLVNGRTSWMRVIDPGELKRRDRARAGGAYYS